MMGNSIKKIILTIVVLVLSYNCKNLDDNNNDENYNTPEKEQKIIEAYLKNPPKKKKPIPIPTDPNERSFDSLKIKALNGDTRSYAFLIIHYSREENRDNFFDLQSISKLMVDKYNHGNACNQIYHDLIKLYNKDKDFDEKLFFNLSKEAKKEAIYYLKKGVTLNDDTCKLILAKSYKHGYGVPKNDKKADSLIRSLNWPKTLTDHELKKL